MTLRVEPISALESNYIWLIHDGSSALLVDPGCAATAKKALDRLALHLTGILLTHHHHDHIGGVETLLQDHPVPVYGPQDDRIQAITDPVDEGTHIHFEHPALTFNVLATPGHTRTHITYYNETMIFCGDTVFSLGCGRLFEGTPAQMQASFDRIAKLKPQALLYCGHEYTQDNGRFARSVDPNNEPLKHYCDRVDALRREGKPSLPVTLAQELKLNPFFRTRHPDIIASAKRHDPQCSNTASDVFATLRAWKDRF